MLVAEHPVDFPRVPARPRIGVRNRPEKDERELETGRRQSVAAAGGRQLPGPAIALTILA